uniref:Uncharacterized protein n=1 Tax=Zea mays TaxID=4577 RepID=A0A804R7Q2_MAIZE
MLAGLFMELRDATRLVVFVTDQFGTTFFTAARDTSVIAQCLSMPMNLHVLSLVVHLPELVASMPDEFRDLAEPVHLPGCVPISGPDIVLSFQDQSDSLYAVMLRLIVRCVKPPMLSSSIPSTPSSLRLPRRCAIQHSPTGHPYHVGPLILQSKFNSGTSIDFFQREEAERRERDDCDGEASWEKKKRGGGDLPVGQLGGCLVAEGKGGRGRGHGLTPCGRGQGQDYLRRRRWRSRRGRRGPGGGGAAEGACERERKGEGAQGGMEHGHRSRQYSRHRDGGVGEWYVGRSQSVAVWGKKGAVVDLRAGGTRMRDSGGGGTEGVDAFVPLLIE